MNYFGNFNYSFLTVLITTSVKKCIRFAYISLQIYAFYYLRGPCFWKLLNYNFKRTNVKIIARKFSQLRDDGNFHFNIFSPFPWNFSRDNYEPNQPKLFYIYIYIYIYRYIFASCKSATRKMFRVCFVAITARHRLDTGTCIRYTCANIRVACQCVICV